MHKCLTHTVTNPAAIQLPGLKGEKITQWIAAIPGKINTLSLLIVVLEQKKETHSITKILKIDLIIITTNSGWNVLILK